MACFQEYVLIIARVTEMTGRDSGIFHVDQPIEAIPSPFHAGRIGLAEVGQVTVLAPASVLSGPSTAQGGKTTS